MVNLNGWVLVHEEECYFTLTKDTLKVEVSSNSSGFRGNRGFLCAAYKDGNLLGTYGSVEYAIEALEK